LAGANKKAYCDTSVFGGVFDPEFSRASISFLSLVRKGIFEIIISPVVEKEIIDAATPPEVISEYERYREFCTIAGVTEESIKLQNAYLRQRILTSKWEDDALHVAVATTNGCDMIVSWNFKHIVNFRKIPLYNAVNILHGYRAIEIYSPLEVIDNEDG
jgi:predicted nucleic acid-binding protein